MEEAGQRRGTAAVARHAPLLQPLAKEVESRALDSPAWRPAAFSVAGARAEIISRARPRVFVTKTLIQSREQAARAGRRHEQSRFSAYPASASAAGKGSGGRGCLAA